MPTAIGSSETPIVISDDEEETVMLPSGSQGIPPPAQGSQRLGDGSRPSRRSASRPPSATQNPQQLCEPESPHQKSTKKRSLESRLRDYDPMLDSEPTLKRRREFNDMHNIHSAPVIYQDGMPPTACHGDDSIPNLFSRPPTSQDDWSSVPSSSKTMEYWPSNAFASQPITSPYDSQPAGTSSTKIWIPQHTDSPGLVDKMNDDLPFNRAILSRRFERSPELHYELDHQHQDKSARGRRSDKPWHDAHRIQRDYYHAHPAGQDSGEVSSYRRNSFGKSNEMTVDFAPNGNDHADRCTSSAHHDFPDASPVNMASGRAERRRASTSTGNVAALASIPTFLPSNPIPSSSAKAPGSSPHLSDSTSHHTEDPSGVKVIKAQLPIGMHFDGPDSKRGVYHKRPEEFLPSEVAARTLVMENIPRKHRNVKFLRWWASTFGVYEQTEMNSALGKGLVTFRARSDAMQAFASPCIAANEGRHGVRVWWYRQPGKHPPAGPTQKEAPVMEEGEIEEVEEIPPPAPPPPPAPEVPRYPSSLTKDDMTLSRKQRKKLRAQQRREKEAKLHIALHDQGRAARISNASLDTPNLIPQSLSLHLAVKEADGPQPCGEESSANYFPQFTPSGHSTISDASGPSPSWTPPGVTSGDVVMSAPPALPGSAVIDDDHFSIASSRAGSPDGCPERISLSKTSVKGVESEPFATAFSSPKLEPIPDQTSTDEVSGYTPSQPLRTEVASAWGIPTHIGPTSAHVSRPVPAQSVLGHPAPRQRQVEATMQNLALPTAAPKKVKASKPVTVGAPVRTGANMVALGTPKHAAAEHSPLQRVPFPLPPKPQPMPMPNPKKERKRRKKDASTALEYDALPETNSLETSLPTLGRPAYAFQFLAPYNTSISPTAVAAALPQDGAYFPMSSLSPSAEAEDSLLSEKLLLSPPGSPTPSPESRVQTLPPLPPPLASTSPAPPTEGLSKEDNLRRMLLEARRSRMNNATKGAPISGLAATEVDVTSSQRTRSPELRQFGHPLRAPETIEHGTSVPGYSLAPPLGNHSLLTEAKEGGYSSQHTQVFHATPAERQLPSRTPTLQDVTPVPNKQSWRSDSPPHPIANPTTLSQEHATATIRRKESTILTTDNESPVNSVPAPSHPGVLDDLAASFLTETFRDIQATSPDLPMAPSAPNGAALTIGIELPAAMDATGAPEVRNLTRVISQRITSSSPTTSMHDVHGSSHILMSHPQVPQFMRQGAPALAASKPAPVVYIASSSGTATPVTGDQSTPVAEFATVASRAQRLERYIADSKVLMAKLATARGKEKDTILARLRLLRKTMDEDVPVKISSPTTAKPFVWPTTAEAMVIIIDDDSGDE